MKKYIDWDAVENTEIDPNATCECTRSKIEGILNFFKRRFTTKGHEGTSCCSSSCCETEKNTQDDNTT